MGIKITRNFDFARKAQEIQVKAQKALETALQDEATEIVSRTQSGKSITGGGFTKYSDGYAEYKAKKGRNTNVDLTFTGNMLKAITTSVQAAGNKIIGKIFFSSAKEAQKATFNQKTRPFFGLSKDQVSRIKQKIREAIRK